MGDEVGGLLHFLGNSGKKVGILVLGGDDPLLGIEIGTEISNVHLPDDLAHLIQGDIGSGHAEKFPRRIVDRLGDTHHVDVGSPLVKVGLGHVHPARRLGAVVPVLILVVEVVI